MTQALIQIDGATGSNPPNGTALALGATVVITNVNNGGETTYLWEWLDRPENSAASFANPATQTTSFVVDVEGTYVIRLTVNAALADERTDIVVAAVSQLLTVERIPGAYETTQANTLRGWAEAINRWLMRLDRLAGDSSTRVGVIVSGANRGQVVIAETADLIRSGLPEEVMCQGYGLALASNLAHVQSPLFVVEGEPDGGTAVGPGALGIVRAGGLFGPLTGAPAVGDPVYVDDGALLSLTPGTYTRQMGVVVWEDGTDYYIAVDATAWRLTSTTEAVLVDSATAPVGFPNAVPIQAIPNTGLEFISPASTLDSDTIVAFVPSASVDTVEITGLGSVRLGQNGYLLGAAASPLRMQAASGRAVSLVPDANVNLRWDINATTGTLIALAVGGQFISNVKTPVLAADAATKAYVDLIGETYRFGNSSITISGGVNYLEPGWQRSATQGDPIPVQVTHAGRLTELRINARVPGSGDPLVFEVYLNGVGTGETATLLDGEVLIVKTIAAPAVAVVAGDLISVGVTSGTSVSPSDVVAAITVTR